MALKRKSDRTHTHPAPFPAKLSFTPAYWSFHTEVICAFVAATFASFRFILFLAFDKSSAPLMSTMRRRHWESLRAQLIVGEKGAVGSQGSKGAWPGAVAEEAAQNWSSHWSRLLYWHLKACDKEVKLYGSPQQWAHTSSFSAAEEAALVAPHLPELECISLRALLSCNVAFA